MLVGIAIPTHDSHVRAKAKWVVASGHLTERSPIKAIDNLNQENTLRHAKAGIRKREDDSGAVVNAVVEYDDDKIVRREDDSGAVVNAVVEYDDDEITK